MSSPSPLPSLLLRLLLGLALLGVARLVHGAFELRSRIIEPPEMGRVLCYDLFSELGNFSFRPPAGWRLELDAPGRRLTLHSSEYDVHLEVRLTGTNAALLPKIDDAGLRRYVLDRFSQAEFLEQFECFAGIGAGQAFDLDWRPAKDVHSLVRMVLIPSAHGSLEFCLTSVPGKAADSRQVLAALMTSFTVISAPAAEAETLPR